VVGNKTCMCKTAAQNVSNIKEDHTLHMPLNVYQVQKIRKHMVCTCFDLRQVWKIRLVSSKSLSDTTQMCTEHSVNAAHFLTHQTVDETVTQVSWSSSKT
jgi:hypothetical protein